MMTILWAKKEASKKPFRNFKKPKPFFNETARNFHETLRFFFAPESAYF